MKTKTLTKKEWTIYNDLQQNKATNKTQKIQKTMNTDTTQRG